MAADQHDCEPRHEATIARQAVRHIRHLAAQLCGYRLAVDDERRHGRACASIAAAFSKRAASVSPAPRTLKRLIRAEAPARRTMSRGGRASARARSLISAALASPALAAARTRALRTVRPSESFSIPSMASRPAFGVRRTA